MQTLDGLQGIYTLEIPDKPLKDCNGLKHWVELATNCSASMRSNLKANQRDLHFIGVPGFLFQNTPW